MPGAARTGGESTACESLTRNSMRLASSRRREARVRTSEEANGPDLLSGLAEQTGGRAFAAVNPAELPDIAAKIGIELRNQYMLYYIPKNLAHHGKYHRLQVKLVKKAGLPALRTAFPNG